MLNNKNSIFTKKSHIILIFAKNQNNIEASNSSSAWERFGIFIFS
jgi:hypothetical protein